jgi:hypothetical protein
MNKIFNFTDMVFPSVIAGNPTRLNQARHQLRWNLCSNVSWHLADGVFAMNLM